MAEAEEARLAAANAAAEAIARLTRARKNRKKGGKDGSASAASSSRSASKTPRSERKKKKKKAADCVEESPRLAELRRRKEAGEELEEAELEELAAALAARKAAAAKPKPRPQALKSGAADPSRELSRHGYEAEGPIGQGAFSTVLRARVVDGGALVAVKSFDNAICAKVRSQAFARDAEIGVLGLLKEKAGRHTHVANMLELLLGPASVHAILEYCGGGSLEWFLQKLKKRKKELIGRDDEGQLLYRGGGHEGMGEAEVVPLAAQIASALCHLHGLEIAHRDIKPGNVLFVDAERTQLKLCDFGFAIRCADHRLKERIGTLLYQAPELVSEPPGYYGKPVDMWAFGGVLYEMLHGRPAFHGTTVPQIENRIRACGHEGVDKSLSAPCKSVISGLLIVSGSKRLRAPEVIGHGWLAASAVAQGLSDCAIDPQCTYVAQPGDVQPGEAASGGAAERLLPTGGTPSVPATSSATSSSASSPATVVDEWLSAFKTFTGIGGGVREAAAESAEEVKHQPTEMCIENSPCRGPDLPDAQVMPAPAPDLPEAQAMPAPVHVS